MANTIANFLVGIGLDFDDKGAKQANTAMDSVKRTALQAGTAIAGAFGVQSVTAGVAGKVAELSRFAEVNGITAQQVQSLGMALERQGGSMASFMDQIGNIEQLRARMLKGDFSFIPEGALSGVDTGAITGAENAIEAYLALAEQFPNLSQQQRLNAAEVFGLDRASILLLTQGRETVEQQMLKFARMREINDSLEKSSIEFERQWADMWDNVGGITDRAGAQILPKVNNLLAAMNNALDDNRDNINSITDDTAKVISDNLETITAGTALLGGSQLLGGIGILASKLPLVGDGFAKVAMGLARFSGAAGALLMVPAASEWIDEMLSNLIDGYDEFDAKFTKALYDITGYDASPDKVYENADKGISPPPPTAEEVEMVRSRQVGYHARFGSGSGYGATRPVTGDPQTTTERIENNNSERIERLTKEVINNNTTNNREVNSRVDSLVERNFVNNSIENSTEKETDRLTERLINNNNNTQRVESETHNNEYFRELIRERGDVTNVLESQINMPQPTVLPPERIAPISAPVMQAQQQVAEQSQRQVAQSSAPSTQRMQPIYINLEGRPFKRMIVETVEERETQTLKDFQSPMER